MERLFKVFTWVIILLLLVSAGFPLLVTISTSLQSHSEVYASSPVLLPAKPQWHNYVDAMQNGNWGRYLFNSAYVTLWTLVLSLAINSWRATRWRASASGAAPRCWRSRWRD